jgi:hypothetical protein
MPDGFDETDPIWIAASMMRDHFASSGLCAPDAPLRKAEMRTLEGFPLWLDFIQLARIARA